MICCLLPLFTVDLVMKNYERFDDEEFIKRFGSLIEGIKI